MNIYENASAYEGQPAIHRVVSSQISKKLWPI